MQEFLFKLYDYNINSLLENDKKRDQVLAFYTGIIGVYFSFGIKELKSLVDQSMYMQWGAIVMMFLINITTMMLLLRYRRFHMICNIGTQVMQRFLANHFLEDEKKYTNKQLQALLNRYFLSIYRYPFSRKPTYYKSISGNSNYKESIGNCFLRLLSFFTGVENMMFAFFAIISSLSLGLTGTVIFDATIGVSIVLIQLLLGFILYCNSLAEDRWLAHPRESKKKNKVDYEKVEWDKIYCGEGAVNIMLDIRGIANEKN